MIKKNKISIIIPLYNGAPHICDALQSLINQTWQNWEAIVINDGSTDNSEELVKGFVEMDNRITLFNQTNNGCSNAKNLGLKFSTGEFIQYLDCDDILSKDKLEKQIKLINVSDDTLAVCKTVVFQDINNLNTGSEINTELLSYSSNPIEFLLNLLGINGNYGMVQPNAYLMSAALAKKIGDWDETLSPSPDEDGEYFCRALMAAKSIVFTEGTNYYRKLKDNQSLSKQKSFKHAIGAFKTVQKKFESIFKKINNPEVLKIYHVQLAEVGYQFGAYYPKIIYEIQKEISATGGNYIPLVGGKTFKLVSKLISFKGAMYLKRLFVQK